MIERVYSGPEKPIKKVLSELFPEVSFSEISACLRRHDVKVDEVRVSSDYLIKNSSVVKIYPKKTREIKVLFEDKNVLACYKPKGIPSEGEVSFSAIVTKEKGNVRLMHRLDTNTDGVLLFAKTDVAYRELFDAMKTGRILKEYTAEVFGIPQNKGEVSLDYYYKKDAEHSRAMISSTEKAGFLPVHLSFIVRERREETALLSVFLHKGKMHQIRAMLAHCGYFILGDGKYGSDVINKRLGASRTRLTACAVTFSFPQSSPLAYLNDVRVTL